MNSVGKRALRRIYGSGKGSVFSTHSFLDLGSRAAVDKALSRLAQKGILRRLARGLYDYPKTHSVLGTLSPHPDKVTKALTTAHGTRVQRSGDYAANLLGLSDQVPAKISFLTDGRSRIVRIGNQEIEFRHANARSLATAGRVSGLVIQALRYLGPKSVDDRTIATLQRKLSVKDKKQLITDISYAPAWIGAHLWRIVGEKLGV